MKSASCEGVLMEILKHTQRVAISSMAMAIEAPFNKDLPMVEGCAF